jgi:hypothetical protein
LVRELISDKLEKHKPEDDSEIPMGGPEKIKQEDSQANRIIVLDTREYEAISLPLDSKPPRGRSVYRVQIPGTD